MSSILKKYGKDGRISFLATAQLHRRRPVKRSFDTYAEAEAWQEAKLEELRELVGSPAHEYTLEEALTEFELCYQKPALPTVDDDIASLLSVALKDLCVEMFMTLFIPDPDLSLLEQVVEHARKHMGVSLPNNPVSALKALRQRTDGEQSLPLKTTQGRKEKGRSEERP